MGLGLMKLCEGWQIYEEHVGKINLFLLRKIITFLIIVFNEIIF